MSGSKEGFMSKVTIRNRAGAEGQLSKGMNMEVLIDGVPVKGASFVKFEVKASKMAKVFIELYAEVEVQMEAELKPVDAGKIIGKTSAGKLIALYKLGAPTASEMVLLETSADQK